MGHEMPVPGDFQDIRGRVGIDGRDHRPRLEQSTHIEVPTPLFRGPEDSETRPLALLQGRRDL
jgi:hypothetical protein